jgi:chaperonin cofactor prefoldin
MGLAASQARLLSLVARKSDLELQLQMINQARTSLANMVGRLSLESANRSDLTWAQQQPTNAALAFLQQRDKILEMNAQRVNTQHEAVQTEIAAVQKVIQRNIQMSFKLMG